MKDNEFLNFENDPGAAKQMEDVEAANIPSVEEFEDPGKDLRLKIVEAFASKKSFGQDLPAGVNLEKYLASLPHAVMFEFTELGINPSNEAGIVQSAINQAVEATPDRPIDQVFAEEIDTKILDRLMAMIKQRKAA